MRAAVVVIALLLTIAPEGRGPAIRWSRETRPAEGARGPIRVPNGALMVTRSVRGQHTAGVACFHSRDNAQTWQRLGVVVVDNDPSTDIGDGNLVWGGEGQVLYCYRQNHTSGPHAAAPDYSIRIAESISGGILWHPHSTVIEVRPAANAQRQTPNASHAAANAQRLTPNASSRSRGLWAPHLFLTSDGILQCYYDDEYAPYQAGFRGHQWVRMKTWNPWKRIWEHPVTVSRAHDTALLSRDGMASVVEIRPGRLLCALESVQTFPPHAGVIRYVTSNDGGATWSWQLEERRVLYEPRNRRFGALCPSLCRLDARTLACIFVTDEDRATPDRPGTPPPELHMDAKYVVSRDSGKTWSRTAEMVYGATHNAYLPALVPLDPGSRDVLALFLDTRRGFLSREGKLTQNPPAL